MSVIFIRDQLAYVLLQHVKRLADEHLEEMIKMRLVAQWIVPRHCRAVLFLFAISPAECRFLLAFSPVSHSSSSRTLKQPRGRDLADRRPEEQIENIERVCTSEPAGEKEEGGPGTGESEKDP